MGVRIAIRDVPEAVRDELASRAARQGRSMQEFLRRSLEAPLATLDGRLTNAAGATCEFVTPEP